MNIEPGDIVTISCKWLTVTAKVETAHNYGTADNPDWYIECRNVRTNEPHYWKQGIEGGSVKLVSKAK